MIRIRRGAAHCRTRDCREREKLVPLAPIALDYPLPACSRSAAIDAEYGTGLGASKLYNECACTSASIPRPAPTPTSRAPRTRTLVGQHSAYAFFSPLVRERAEAEHLARQLLLRLNGERGEVRPLSQRATRQELRDEGWRLAVRESQRS